MFVYTYFSKESGKSMVLKAHFFHFERCVREIYHLNRPPSAHSSNLSQLRVSSSLRPLRSVVEEYTTHSPHPYRRPNASGERRIPNVSPLFQIRHQAPHRGQIGPHEIVMFLFLGLDPETTPTVVGYHRAASTSLTAFQPPS